MNEKIKNILDEAEDELIENGCFYVLDTATEAEIIFNYAHYWDGYPEFAEQIQQETENLLSLHDSLVSAGFSGFFWVGDFVRW